MKVHQYIITAAAVLLLASCVTTSGGGSGSSTASSSKGEPAWLQNKGSLYPEDKFLVEIGEGNSLNGARDNAKTSLARIFRTTIIVDSTVTTRYSDLSDGKTILESSMETTADETLTQLSDETLINVHFGENWTSPLGKVYVIAYIDRVETAQIYRQRIERDGERAAYFINQSGRENDLIRRFGFLDAAMVMDAEISSKRDQLEIINPPFARMIMLPYEPKDLRSLHADTAKQMLFSVVIDGDEEGKLKAMVSQVLTDRGFSLSDGAGRLSVTGRLIMENVILNNDYENVRWTLFLEMRNEAGEVICTMEEKKRESAISIDEARARSYRSMEKAMKKSFIGALEDYFDSYAGS